MARLIVLLTFIACSAPPSPVTPAPIADDLVTIESGSDHAATIAKLVAAVEGRGFVVVHRIDHAAAAQTAGLELAPSTVIVFGNPKGGTPLMQATPTLGLDLPLRVLVWQANGGAKLTYREHQIAKLSAVLAEVVAEAAK